MAISHRFLSLPGHTKLTEQYIQILPEDQKKRKIITALFSLTPASIILSSNTYTHRHTLRFAVVAQ